MFITSSGVGPAPPTTESFVRQFLERSPRSLGGSSFLPHSGGTLHTVQELLAGGDPRRGVFDLNLELVLVAPAVRLVPRVLVALEGDSFRLGGGPHDLEQG